MAHFEKGTELRLEIKNLVYDFMLKCDDCSCDALGMKQAEIFRACGLDWGEYPNATSSNLRTPGQNYTLTVGSPTL